MAYACETLFCDRSISSGWEDQDWGCDDEQQCKWKTWWCKNWSKRTRDGAAIDEIILMTWWWWFCSSSSPSCCWCCCRCYGVKVGPDFSSIQMGHGIIPHQGTCIFLLSTRHATGQTWPHLNFFVLFRVLFLLSKSLYRVSHSSLSSSQRKNILHKPLHQTLTFSFHHFFRYDCWIKTDCFVFFSSAHPPLTLFSQTEWEGSRKRRRYSAKGSKTGSLSILFTSYRQGSSITCNRYNLMISADTRIIFYPICGI